MVRIVADSATDLPASVINELGITIVPAKVWFGDEFIVDDVYYNKADYYSRVENSENIPRSTPASPKTFYDAFASSTEETLAIFISKHLSDFHKNALLATQKFGLHHVTLYETDSVSMGGGIFVYHAAQMARRGYSIQEIVAKLDSIKEDVILYAVMPTVKYLHAGGRISTQRAVIALLLNISPILRMEDELEAIASVPGFDKAVQKMINIITTRFKGKDVDVTLIHAQNIEKLNEIGVILKKELRVFNVIVSDIGSAVGANTGPSSVGVVISPHIRY